MYGKDEWQQEKHRVVARRTWRKLHLAVDEYHQIIACELTMPETGDPTVCSTCSTNWTARSTNLLVTSPMMANRWPMRSWSYSRMRPLSSHRTRRRSVHPKATPSVTGTSLPSGGKTASPGRSKRAMAYAIMPSLPYNATSASSATRSKRVNCRNKRRSMGFCPCP
ncbi:hypothetical protein [Nitrosomonas sp.]|uniref:hypothetical protein n=1 Tax=Nitrosomonas sp. TaxID=42353 RepID=UPI003A5C1798